MLDSHETILMTPEPASFSKFHCNSPLFGTEKTPVDHRPFKPHYAGLSTADASTTNSSNGAAAEDGPREGFQQPDARLSDVNLASRKANEAAVRRFQAASWLQKIVGPLDLPMEPSEEELRLCLRNGLVLCSLINKIQPGAIPKIVENPTPSSPPPEGAALSAYQYFENVRNFLVAVEEMKLPSFEASDLEKGSLQTGLSAKVVDCILSLKAYHEWQRSGGHGSWKFGGSLKSPCAPKSSSKPLLGSCSVANVRFSEPLSISTSKANSQHRKRWAIPGSDSPKNLSEEFSSPFANTGKAGHMNGLWKGHCINDPLEESENAWPNFSISADPATAWVNHMGQKFVDVFRAKNKNAQEVAAFELPGTTSVIDSMSSQSLMKLVMMILRDKQPEEVPVLVELMLRKVMEEFEHRLSCQEKQIKRCQGQVVGDLSNGSKDCEEQQATIEALQLELDRLKCMDQEREFCLEIQKSEVKDLKCLLETIRQEFQHMQIEWGNEMEALDVKLIGLTQAAAEYHKVAAENRELYNQVQDLKGNIRVYCRVRPFLPGQKGTQSTVDFIGEKGSIMIANPAKQGKDQRKTFNFNKVFGPSAAQEEVFLDTQPLIRSVLDGYNVCIFAYGQTGSGKTYTMTGPNNPSPKDWGVNFRALHDLFQISQNRKDLMKYEVGVQMIEIYNEQVRDLLCADGSNKRLEIRNSSQQNGLNVPDANMVPVESTADVLELMTTGHRNRAVGATALNERSSRSHSVLTVHVKGTDLASGALLRGCLHLVDLAGSERVDKSEATGDRLKEAQHINRSLSALGDVIAALAQKSAHIPYRNSKLTQLLQDSLGGQAKTLMFVHMSPDEDSYGETLSTLKFAERVATVELGAAQSNKESGEVRELKDQIAFLKDALAKKDAELERVPKEARSKGIECGPDKTRLMKAGTSPSPFRRMSMDVHSQGNRRQPLEEVRNAEVRQSPNLGVAIPKCIPTSDFRSLDLQFGPQPLSPTGHGVFYASHEEDSIQRRASKVPRQGSSPESRSSNSDFSFNSASTSTRGNVSKNKIRHETSEDQETIPRTSSQERVRVSRSVTVQSTGCPDETVKAQHGDEQAAASVFSYIRENGHGKAVDRKKEPKFVDEPSLPNIYPEAALKGTRSDSKRLNSQLKRSFQSSKEADLSQDYSTEDSTGRRGDADEETSDYSEAELWPKETDVSLAVEQQTKSNNNNFASGVGKLRQSVDRRSSNQVTQSGPPARNDRKVVGAVVGQGHTRSRRYSLVGSTTFGVEGLTSKRTGGKATLEAKLIAISSEGAAVECYAKTTLPRQSYNVQAAAPSSSKSSKRWL